MCLQIGETRLEAQSEPVHDGEVGLVDAVHIAANHGRHDVGCVAVPDIEDMMSLKLMRADDPALQRNVVTQQRVGHNALPAAKILARVPRLHGRPLHAELLAVDAAVERIEVERVVRENGQAGNGVADLVVGRLQRRLAQVLLVGRLQYMVGDVAGA